MLLVGDGSGTTIDSPSGWCVFVFETPSRRVHRLMGSFSNGTNNQAELTPYIQALWTVYAFDQKPKRVCIVSDSEVTVRCGSRTYGRHANGALWASIDWFEAAADFRLRWHHVKRNSNELSKLADRFAGQVRKAMLASMAS